MDGQRFCESKIQGMDMSGKYINLMCRLLCMQFCFKESYMTKYPTLSLLRHPGRAAMETHYFEATLAAMNKTCAQATSSFLAASSLMSCANQGASVCRYAVLH